MTDQLKRAISAAKTAQTDSEQAEAISVASSSAGDQNFDMSESSYKTSHTAIRKARRFAMQGLYEWLITDHRFDNNGKLGWKANAPNDIAARTRATNAMHTVHLGYYHEMMHDIPEQIESLNALITQHLDREIDKLDTVEHAILLIGAYELQNRLEIPYKVVLDEAMKLNNHFGATDAHKLINAVLDRMAVELRAAEVQADIKANLRTSQKASIKQTKVGSDGSQVDTTENVAGTEATPTASTKPRISANNANVKRNRPNKANAGMTNAKAAIKDRVKAVSTEPLIAENTDDAVVNDTVVSTDPIIDNANTLADSESSIAKSDVLESKISENDVTDSVESSVESSHPDSVHVEADNSETVITESADSDADSIDSDSVKSDDTKENANKLTDTELDSSDLNSTDMNSTDEKSND
ncbi:N utilization substance protein B [Psychrobacter sp. PL19]|uniref:transcription antitermination factor NusB n=1 Tax=Psychrobacter sp. PL19 TaxID=2760711 RepID=UPI001AE0F872